MLGGSALIGTNTASGDGATATSQGGGAAAAQETGEQLTAPPLPGGVGVGGFSEERIEGEERAGGGNRWPRQETLALLKIRSDMDVAFRDSSLKGPLWEQVSRKMAELGYQRSAKKCKEKFENVYKYHKRTKPNRSSKPEGKTYRFFDQLEALENTSSSIQLQTLPPPQPLPSQQRPQPPPQMAVVNNNNNNNATVSSTPNAAPASAPQNFSNLITSSFPPSQTMLQPISTTTAATNIANPPLPVPIPHMNISTSFLSNSTFSSSSSTSSDEDMERRQKRKRKWKDYFERLMKDVIGKQEELQKKFLDTLEKRERDRMIREEAWRVQEMARINRERELLVQERSMAAARESALISFLQKMNNDQKNPNSTHPPQVQIPVQLPENPSPQPAPAQPVVASTPPPPPPSIPAAATTTPVMSPLPLRTVDNNTPRSDNGGDSNSNFMMGGGGSTSSRWPKAEVQALINLRTSLDNKYQESGPKGPLWEEISAGMRKLGYNRNAKRCKEKWENINKYFKKVKESNKKRPEDSKTCPYFHQLDALYREKAKAGDVSSSSYKPESSVAAGGMQQPIMARPEQQWPLPQVIQHQEHHHQHHQHQQQMQMGEHEGENADQDDDDDDDDDGDEDEEDEGSGYEIVTNKHQQPPSVASTS